MASSCPAIYLSDVHMDSEKLTERRSTNCWNNALTSFTNGRSVNCFRNKNRLRYGHCERSSNPWLNQRLQWFPVPFPKETIRVVRGSLNSAPLKVIGS